MSQENVALIHTIADLYNAGEMEAYFELHDPEFEGLPDAVFPEARRLSGRDAFRRFMSEISSSWEQPRFLVSEVLVIDEDRVLVRGDWGGKGLSSGVETYANLSQLLTIRDGKVVRGEYFFDHAKALEAAGLAE